MAPAVAGSSPVGHPTVTPGKSAEGGAPGAKVAAASAAVNAAADDDDVARLTRAIDRACAAEKWAVVELLGRQLEALTRSRTPNVVELAARRRRLGLQTDRFLGMPVKAWPVLSKVCREWPHITLTGFPRAALPLVRYGAASGRRFDSVSLETVAHSAAICCAFTVKWPRLSARLMA